MSTLHQALRIARKDLVEARWLGLVYVALVAMATVHVARAASLGPMDDPQMPMVFVVMAGMLFVATVVQADAPARADAFWAARPFQPSAVLAAKLLVMLVVTGVGLLGQAIVITAYGLHGTALATRLPPSAGTYALWLLVAMLIASLARDLKTFVTMTVCIVIAPGWATIVLLSPTTLDTQGAATIGVTVNASPASVALLRAAAWLGTIGCILLLLWIYRTTDLRRWARTASIAAAACGLLAAMNPPWIASAWTSSWNKSSFGVSPTPGIARAAVSTAFVLSATDPANDSLVIRATPPSPDARLTVLSTDVAITLKDGSTIHVAGPSSGDLVRPELPGVRWVSGSADSAHGLTTSLSPIPRARDAMARGITRVSISPWIAASVPHVIGSMQLANGSLFVHDGLTARIESWSYGSGDGIVDLRISSMPRGNYTDPSDDLEYALINDVRHEALPLFRRRAVGGGSNSLVLPGDSARTNVFELSTRADTSGALEARDPTWFRSARLVLIDKGELGTYTVHTNAVLR